PLGPPRPRRPPPGAPPHAREPALRRVVDTTYDPLQVCHTLLADLTWDRLTCTGYGRHLFAEHWPEAAVITEIKAVSTGAAHLLPGCRALVDIGGQDTKVVTLDPAGRVRKFAMNDRCAAGTGRFLEVMATALAFERDAFIAAAQRAPRAEKLSSMCAVFAESEVVSLVARGRDRDAIALGIHTAIAQRTAGLARTLPLEDPLLFAGGGALNAALAPLLEAALGHPLHVPESPQTVAALGCALVGERG
ncbi:MAG: acyl-CoA dehydratase activase, partial [Pseudomonadota bacterium]